MSRIEIVGLTQQFKGHRAVDGIDLVIDDGDFVVLLGPSGCGKTTLLRMIAGLLEPTSGSIRIDGVDVTGLLPKKRNLAMVFQSYALYPHLSVEKNLAFPLGVLRMPAEEKQIRVKRAAWGWRRCCSASPESSRAVSVSASPWAAHSCASPVPT